MIGVPKKNRTRDTSMVSDTHYATNRPERPGILSIYSELPPCGHLAITDSSKIPGESYRRLTEINSPYYGLSLLRTYGHFIRSQRHNFIVFSLVIADTEQHLGIFAHISSLFFLLFETVFVFFGRFPLLLSINQNSFIFSPKALFAVSLS